MFSARKIFMIYFPITLSLIICTSGGNLLDNIMYRVHLGRGYLQNSILNPMIGGSGSQKYYQPSFGEEGAFGHHHSSYQSHGHGGGGLGGFDPFSILGALSFATLVAALIANAANSSGRSMDDNMGEMFPQFLQTINLPKLQDIMAKSQGSSAQNPFNLPLLSSLSKKFNSESA